MTDQPASVLREGRATLPLPYWLWVPGVAVLGFGVGLLALGGSVAAVLVGLAAALLAGAVLGTMASWRWRITPTDVEVGRLSWPAWRGGRHLHLSRVGRVEVLGGHRGTVVVEQGVGIGVAGPDAISPLQAAGQRVVIDTGTEQEARETARVLRQAVAAIREQYPIPPEHHVRLVPGPKPAQPTPPVPPQSS